MWYMIFLFLLLIFDDSDIIYITCILGVIQMLFYGLVKDDLIQPIYCDSKEDALLELRLRFGPNIVFISEDEFRENFKKEVFNFLPCIK